MTHNVYAPPQAKIEDVPQSSETMGEERIVSFDTLVRTDRWRLVWGFFWRSVCVALLSMLGGAIAGAVIGFVTVLIAQGFGKSLDDVVLPIRILSGTAGLLVGFAALWQLVRWYFRTSWFGYRLRLVKDVV